MFLKIDEPLGSLQFYTITNIATLEVICDVFLCTSARFSLVVELQNRRVCTFKVLIDMNITFDACVIFSCVLMLLFQLFQLMIR